MESPNFFEMSEEEYTTYITNMYVSELSSEVLKDFKLSASVIILFMFGLYMAYQALHMKPEDFRYDELEELSTFGKKMKFNILF